MIWTVFLCTGCYADFLFCRSWYRIRVGCDHERRNDLSARYGVRKKDSSCVFYLSGRRTRDWQAFPSQRMTVSYDVTTFLSILEVH